MPAHLLSGLELIAPRLPPDCEPLRGPGAPPLSDPLDAFKVALAQPLGGPPLSNRVGPRSHVLITVPSPDALVPCGEVNPLRLGVRAILDALRVAGVAQRSVKLLVANGLGRRAPMTDLARALGVEVTGAYEVATFDAEEHRAHRSIANQELASALTEADLVVDLSVRAHGGKPVLANLVEGVATHAGLRELHAPGLDESVRMQRAVARARALAGALPIFSLAIAVSEAAFSGRTRALVGAGARAWNRLPLAVRARAAAAFRSAATPIAAFAGEPLSAESRADEVACAAVRVPDGERFDALVIGVPDLSPDSPHGKSNPVLAAHLGLVTLLARARHRLRDGGAVILANPLEDRIERPLHLPYVEFYERALRVAPTGAELASRFELEFSGRPELVAAYRRKGAMHGAHPFHRWYELESVRAGLRVYAAGAGAAAAQRVGVEPADSIEAALAQASEASGTSRPRVAVLDLLQIGA